MDWLPLFHFFCFNVGQPLTAVQILFPFDRALHLVRFVSKLDRPHPQLLDHFGIIRNLRQSSTFSRLFAQILGVCMGRALLRIFTVFQNT